MWTTALLGLLGGAAATAGLFFLLYHYMRRAHAAEVDILRMRLEISEGELDERAKLIDQLRKSDDEVVRWGLQQALNALPAPTARVIVDNMRARRMHKDGRQEGGDKADKATPEGAVVPGPWITDLS